MKQDQQTTCSGSRGRVSEWEARVMRKYDKEQEALAREQGQQVRARIQRRS